MILMCSVPLSVFILSRGEETNLIGEMNCFFPSLPPAKTGSKHNYYLYITIGPITPMWVNSIPSPPVFLYLGDFS